MQMFPKESLPKDSLKVQPTSIITSVITIRQRSCRKVMFSVMSVCLSFHPQGGPMWPLPIMHWTSLYRVLPPCRGTHLCTGPTLASDIWWPRLDTCSNSFTWGFPMVLTSGGGYCRSIYSHCKQAVSILLECFLVFFVFFISTNNGIKWVWLH